MEMMVMMIPMKSSLMKVTMASISPPGGISSVDCSLPESFSLSRVSAPWRRRNFSWTMYYALGLPRVEVRERGLTLVGQGHDTTCSCVERWDRAARWCGPHRHHVGPPFGSPVIWDNRSFSMIFVRIGFS